VCEAIRHGRVPELSAPDWARREGVGFVDAAPDAVTPTVIDVLARLGPNCGAQVVGSVKARAGGTDEINRSIQSLRAIGKKPLNGRFFAGDPVLVTSNDYDLGVMNGDLGTALADAEAGGLRCRFEDGEKVLPAATLNDAELGYAITCHKAQGSQFPYVVVPITDNRLLDRTLLLTAVSRAQHAVVLVGDRNAFERAVAAPPRSDVRAVGLGRAGGREAT
jgi:exodeoxyribonuclease V alpha subunit